MIKKIYQMYNSIERSFMGLIMLFMVLFGFLQVIFRFVLQIPMHWLEDLMMFIMCWVAYLGASTAANERKHIMINMIVDLLPGRLRKVVTILSQLVWLASLWFLIYLGAQVTSNHIERGTVTIGGRFPIWVSSIIIPIGAFLVSIRLIILIVQTIRGERDTRTVEEIVREETE